MNIGALWSLASRVTGSASAAYRASQRSASERPRRNAALDRVRHDHARGRLRSAQPEDVDALRRRLPALRRVQRLHAGLAEASGVAGLADRPAGLDAAAAANPVRRAGVGSGRPAAADSRGAVRLSSAHGGADRVPDLHSRLCPHRDLLRRAVHGLGPDPDPDRLLCSGGGAGARAGLRSDARLGLAGAHPGQSRRRGDHRPGGDRFCADHHHGPAAGPVGRHPVPAARPQLWRPGPGGEGRVDQPAQGSSPDGRAVRHLVDPGSAPLRRSSGQPRGFPTF